MTSAAVAAPRASRRLPGTAAGWTVVAAGVAIALLSATLLSATRTIAHATASPTAVLLTLGACGALLIAAAGAVTARMGAYPALLTGIAVASLGAVWAGASDASDLVRSIGAVSGAVMTPLLLHVIVAAPKGRLSRGPARAAVAVVWAVVAALLVAVALVRDPFLDPHCWSNCSINVFLAWPAPDLAAFLGDALLASTIAAAVMAIALVGFRLSRVRGIARREVSRIGITGAVALVAQAAYAAILLANPAEHVSQPIHEWAYAVRAGGLIGLGIAVAWTAMDAHLRRQRLGRLAQDIEAAPSPGRLARALGDSLGDSRLDVFYPLAETGLFVDATGEPRDLTVPPGQAATEVRRGDDLVAVVLHDAGLAQDARLAEGIGAAARLAIDNERLRARVLAQLRELRESRARVVETADSARGAIERDLHDGAQQSLVAVLYELSLAAVSARADGDDQAARAFAHAGRTVASTLERLRSLARGPYPAALDERGLDAAIQQLSEDIAVVVDARVQLTRRPPRAAERAAFSVARSVARAAAKTDRGMEIDIIDDQVDLIVMAAGGVPDDLEALRDRVGALGGTVAVIEGGVRAVIPCG